MSYNLCYLKALRFWPASAQESLQNIAWSDKEMEHMKDMLGYREDKMKRYKMDRIRAVEGIERKRWRQYPK